MSGGEATCRGGAAGPSSSTKTSSAAPLPSAGNIIIQNGLDSAGTNEKSATSAAATTPDAKFTASSVDVGSSSSPTPTLENDNTPRYSTHTASEIRHSALSSSGIVTKEGLTLDGTVASPSSAENTPPAHDSTQAVATSLLNLEVKVLTQPLGAENQWEEQGDGRVSFCDFTIRVVAPRASKDEAQKTKEQVSSGGVAPTEGSTSSTTVSEFDEDDQGNDMVILEDTISNDTPFVGENCCIVWNSFEKQLSLCLMYASEEGYSASWSALVALQDKSYPPFRFDLLERCQSSSSRAVPAPAEGTASVASGTPATDQKGQTLRPYSFFIHTKYDPPLGFIEQHALSLSIMEHGHATNPALYANRETVLIMLNLASADLLDTLLSEDTFALLLKGLQCTLVPSVWSVPEPLQSLQVPEEVATFIRKDRYISFLLDSVFPGSGTSDLVTELMAKYSTMSRRFRNEIVCALLTCDSTFSEACEALRVVPGTVGSGASGLHRVSSSEVLSHTASLSSDGRTSTGAPGNVTLSRLSTPPPTDTISSMQKAEQQVIAHLRFFRELVCLSIAELGRDMVGPIVGKVFQSGLLEPLSLVAERFAMPSGAAAVFLKYIAGANERVHSGARRAGGAPTPSISNSTPGFAPTTHANYYSHAVEEELSALLDVTLVRLNERQEEQLMNEHVRMPILADPVKYNGFVTFMLRQLVVGGASGAAFSGSSASTHTGAGRSPGGALSAPKRILRDSMSTSNPYVLFHVLGLHDDEGSAASERTLDTDHTNIRNRFHSFIITKYLTHAARGLMAPVPLPPTLVGVSGPSRSIPIVSFNTAGTSQNGGRVPISQDGNESHAVPTVAEVSSTVQESGENGSYGVSGPSSSCGLASPASSLPQGITPALIRVFEYMVLLASSTNRELILKTIFHHKSRIWHFIEGVCEILCGANGASGRCQVGLDVLCSCVRFLKVIIVHMTVVAVVPDEHPLPSYVPLREPLSSQLLTTISRYLTVERDTFGYLLRVYHRLGGMRRRSLFHSSFLALLDIIGKPSSRGSSDFFTNNLRDVRDFLFYKHLKELPEVFVCRYREALLTEVTLRLGGEATHSPNDSMSVLSSTVGSELARSSSKLRFVDEVEAVAGGSDSAVVLSNVLSPAIIASMASAEDKQRKGSCRMSMGQWGLPSNHVMGLPPHTRSPTPLNFSDDHGGRVTSSSASPNHANSCLPINISRPTSNSSNSHRVTVVDVTTTSTLPHIGPSADGEGHLGHSSPSNEAESNSNQTDTGLRPTAPREGKPPGRPRSFASVLENPSRTSATATGESCGRSQSVPNFCSEGATLFSSPEETLAGKSDKGSAPQSLESQDRAFSLSNESIILPKVKKRMPNTGKRT